MELSLINTPHSNHAGKQDHPFVHLDSHLGAGWSTVFASSKSHVVVKFASVPKKDKIELIRQLSNEKLAYNKLNRISGWVVPRLYGEYEWYGGRALLLSEEGQSLSCLDKFSSLSFIERYALACRDSRAVLTFLYGRLTLFAEIYCMHYLGIEHRDLEPRNVLRKRHSRIFKIIDFGFSDVEHTCPGWRECYELKEVWRELQLDRVNLQFKSMVWEFKIRPVALLLFIIGLLAFVIIKTLIPIISSIVEIHRTCVYCT